MADPLSMVASVAGVIALAASTARTVTSMIQEIQDAPEEILHIRRDVQNLSAVLGSIQELCGRYDLPSEEPKLVESMAECLSLCQDSMQSIRVVLTPLSGTASGRRSPMRMFGWIMKKGEIRTLRERLQESKASLNITISTLIGALEGKGQDEIRSDVNNVYQKLVSEIRSRDSGRRLKKRMEDDVASVSASGGRRRSISDSTDAGFALNRYFDQLPEPSQSPQSYQSEEGLLRPYSSTPTNLLEAVRARDKDGVIRLISSGSPTTGRTQDGQTALHLCAIYNDLEMAQVLLDHGANINARDDHLRSPLSVALSSEAISVASLLVQKGCSLTGCLEMIFPLTQRLEEIPDIEELLKSIAPKFNKLTTGPYLVHQAVELNDRQSLTALLSAGFDPNIRNKYGLPPLYEAMLLQQHQTVRLLLNHGANQNDFLPGETQDKLDKDIRIHARLSGWISADAGIIPLVVAGRVLRDAEMTRILLESGADPNFLFPSNGGVTLSGLGDIEYLECAKLIIEAGADVHIGGKSGLDPFYWANACRNPELIEFMLNHGADVNHSYNDENPTILFRVARWGYDDSAEILVRYGADLTVRNYEKKMALDIAREYQRHEVVAILEKAGAK